MLLESNLKINRYYKLNNAHPSFYTYLTCNYRIKTFKNKNDKSIGEKYVSRKQPQNLTIAGLNFMSINSGMCGMNGGRIQLI